MQRRDSLVGSSAPSPSHSRETTVTRARRSPLQGTVHHKALLLDIGLQVVGTESLKGLPSPTIPHLMGMVYPRLLQFSPQHPGLHSISPVMGMAFPKGHRCIIPLPGPYMILRKAKGKWVASDPQLSSPRADHPLLEAARMPGMSSLAG